MAALIRTLRLCFNLFWEHYYAVTIQTSIPISREESFNLFWEHYYAVTGGSNLFIFSSLFFEDISALVCFIDPCYTRVHKALNIVFDELQDLGITVADDPEITVQNIVSSADLDQQLNLNAIAIGFGLEDVEYEPEQFPGLVYRLEDPDVVVLLFGSGKLVITGGTEPVDAEKALESVRSQLTDLGMLE